MSRLKTDAIRNVNASVDGITLDTSGNVVIPEGKVSIGTGTARQLLHLNVDDSGAANIVFTNTTTGTAASDGFVIGITGSEDGQIWHQESANIKFGTGDSERLRIHSTGKITVNSTGTQPSPTVGGFQLDMGSYPGTMRLSSGAGTSGTNSGSFTIIGSNHNASLEHGANHGSQLNLVNANSSDGNSTTVSFYNKNQLSTSRILGVNVSHTSRTGALVFMTSNGSHPVEKLRITSDGKVGIGLTPQATLDVNNIDSSSAGNHSFQMGSYGIRTNDTNSYNHWYIERNYGGWQSTPQVVLKASGHTGFNISNPTKVIHGEDSSATETNVLALRNYKSSVNTKPTLVFEASSSAGQGANSSIQGLAGTDAGGVANANDSGMKFIVRHGGSGTEREAFSVKKDGNIYFPSGQGVSFAATSDAANNANVAELLDDYEEGRHIVSITGSSSNPTVNLTMANLWYVKVGSLVTLSGELRWTTSSHGSGTLRISLPFAAKNLGTGHSFQGTAQTWNIDWKHDQSSTDYILSEVGGNTSYMFIRCAANDNLSEDSLKLGSNVIGSANSGYGVELCVSLSYRAE